MISLAAAATLTEWSKRTLWRRISDGTFTRTDGEKALHDKKTKIDLDIIRPHICIPIESGDLELIEAADAGDSEAQTDLAVLFLSNGKPESAIYWLELAAKQNSASGMYWLGRCYIDGKGVTVDENLGVMWVAKAASLGHMISKTLMNAILAKITGQENRI